MIYNFYLRWTSPRWVLFTQVHQAAICVSRKKLYTYTTSHSKKSDLDKLKSIREFSGASTVLIWNIRIWMR